MQTYNLPQNPKCLIFDIDSTLYTNSEYAHEQIDSQIRYFADLRGITHKEASDMVQDFRREWAAEHDGQRISLGNLFTNFGITIDESIEWRKRLFDPAAYLTRDEELITVLTELKKKFYLICVTNNPVEPARKTLEVIGIDKIIPDIIGLDTCRVSKPAVLPLKKALEKARENTGLLLGFEDCISIGDRYDIDLALPLQLGAGGILVDRVSDLYNLDKLLQI